MVVLSMLILVGLIILAINGGGKREKRRARMAKSKQMSTAAMLNKSRVRGAKTYHTMQRYQKASGRKSW